MGSPWGTAAATITTTTIVTTTQIPSRPRPRSRPPTCNEETQASVGQFVTRPVLTDNKQNNETTSRHQNY